jgi:hypothetical protein
MIIDIVHDDQLSMCKRIKIQTSNISCCYLVSSKCLNLMHKFQTNGKQRKQYNFFLKASYTCTETGLSPTKGENLEENLT